MKNIKFGTDGVRGVWGKDIDRSVCTLIGVAIRMYFGEGRYIVGRDSRPSGVCMLQAMLSGISGDNVDVVDVGIVPTPVVAFGTKLYQCNCGIVLTASHNPCEYNGIKIFGSDGSKLSPMIEQEFGHLLNQLQESKYDLYPVIRPTYVDITREYIDSIVRDMPSLSSLSVSLDCSCGAMGDLAQRAFEKLGAHVVAYNTEYDGNSINANCGALYPQFLLQRMQQDNTNVGFCFDGDADRLVVLHNDRIVDGDSVLYNIAQTIDFGTNNTVVATELSNGGLHKAFNQQGLKLIRTSVGDKYIVQEMIQHDYILGGEQSGHYIIRPYATTGDGLLASLFFCKSLLLNNPPQLIPLIPQKSVAIYTSHSIVDSIELAQLVAKYNLMLKPIEGRVVVRYSGTEPKIRMMVECVDSALIDTILQDFVDFVTNYNRIDYNKAVKLVAN